MVLRSRKVSRSRALNALAILCLLVSVHQAVATEVPFGSQSVISTTADLPRTVFAADVDGDGDMDALSASGTDSKIAWYENTAGNGSAWTARTISTAAVQAFAVFAADVDGDGDVDALSASGTGETCLVNGTTGTTWPETTTPNPGQGYYCIVRGTNHCGIGSYGSPSSGGPRTSTACQ